MHLRHVRNDHEIEFGAVRCEMGRHVFTLLRRSHDAADSVAVLEQRARDPHTHVAIRARNEHRRTSLDDGHV